jgi:hypothetical protein
VLLRASNAARATHEQQLAHDVEGLTGGAGAGGGAAAADGAGPITAYTPHSQVRTEVSRLSAALKAEEQRGEGLLAKNRRMVVKFREMEGEMTRMHAEGIRVHEALSMELSMQQHGEIHGHRQLSPGAGGSPADRANVKLMQRVEDLERLMSHKNHALAVAEQRLQTSALGGDGLFEHRSTTPRRQQLRTAFGAEHSGAGAAYQRGLHIPSRGPSPRREEAKPAFRPAAAIFRERER